MGIIWYFLVKFAEHMYCLYRRNRINKVMPSIIQSPPVYPISMPTMQPSFETVHFPQEIQHSAIQIMEQPSTNTNGFEAPQAQKQITINAQMLRILHNASRRDVD